MIRDWTIIRAILLKLESANTPNAAITPTDLPEFPEQEVAYNMRLLNEAGYIKGRILESSSGDGLIAAALAQALTNNGHELLNTIRNDTVWKKIQGQFQEKGLEMTFDLVVMVGKRAMEAMLS